MTWLPLVAAAVLVAVVLLVALTAGSGHGDGFDLASSPTIPSGHAAQAVVHDGDTVRGSGLVVVGADGAGRFCAPDAEHSGVANGHECTLGIAVTGVDPARLSKARRDPSGTRGLATLTGTYRSGAMRVTKQAPYEARPLQLYRDQPPCVAPDGGWPRGHVAVDLSPVRRYEQRHPAAILATAVLRPSRDQAVAYVVTSGNPDAVGKALLPAFGKRLCVVQSPYAVRDVVAARRLLSSHRGRALTDVTGTDAAAVDGHGRLEIRASVPLLTDRLAHLIDEQPAGLIQLDVWLRPVG